MKKQIRKLSLGRETLRQLTDAPLGEAVGGATTLSVCATNCGCQHETSFVCPSGARC